MGLKNNSNFYYYLFWLLFSFTAFSFAWLWAQYCLVRFELKRAVTGKIEEDDILDIKTFAGNHGFIPATNVVIQYQLGCALKEERRASFLINYLAAGASIDFIYRCVCPQRGRYEIGPFEIYFFDPLGLFFLKKTYGINTEIYVYPRTFHIRNFPQIAKGAMPWFGIETARVSPDEDEFYGIREYKSGDPIKKIHWASSARKNHLIVKQFQRQSFLRASIIFTLEKESNFGEDKECVAEYIIKIAASLAKYLIDSGVSVEIIAHTGESVHIPFNKGPEHLEDILKFLAAAQAKSNKNLLEVFESFSAYISKDSTLIAIMLDKDKGYLPAMLSLEARNISLLPIFLAASTFRKEPGAQEAANIFDAKLPETVNLNPIYISQGENWEAKF